MPCEYAPTSGSGRHTFRRGYGSQVGSQDVVDLVMRFAVLRQRLVEVYEIPSVVVPSMTYSERTIPELFLSMGSMVDFQVHSTASFMSSGAVRLTLRQSVIS